MKVLKLDTAKRMEQVNGDRGEASQGAIKGKIKSKWAGSCSQGSDRQRRTTNVATVSVC
jgi:hypothetical protein